MTTKADAGCSRSARYAPKHDHPLHPALQRIHTTHAPPHSPTMISQSLPLFALLATSLTLSTPPSSSLIQLPTQNATTPTPPSSNTTSTRLGGWPAAPFSRHLAWDTDIEIISRTPAPPTDPTSEMGVLEGISLIGAKARARSRLSSIEDFHEESGPVSFDFHATEDLFRGSDVAMILDALWEMTNLYGKGEVYGCLVRVEVHIAYFELGLKKVLGVE